MAFWGAMGKGDGVAIMVEDGDEASCGTGCARLVSWTWQACWMSVMGLAARVSSSDRHSAGSEEVMPLIVQVIPVIMKTQ